MRLSTKAYYVASATVAGMLISAASASAAGLPIGLDQTAGGLATTATQGIAAGQGAVPLGLLSGLLGGALGGGIVPGL